MLIMFLFLLKIFLLEVEFLSTFLKELYGFDAGIINIFFVV